MRKMPHHTCACYLLCALLLIGGPMMVAAHAQGATVERTSFRFTRFVSSTDPCSGAAVSGDTDVQVHMMDVIDGSGGEHILFVELVTGQLVDALGNTYVAGQTVQGVGTATSDEDVVVITALTDLHFVSTNSDENYIAHVMIRFTITPNGTQADMTFISTECRG
jgi:hypothetical protein